MKLYLIDGTFELFRAWFSFPSSQNDKRQEVGASRGLLRSLVKLIKTEKPDFIACAFDHRIESFRNELFSGYKTGEGIDPDLFSQFSLVEDVAAALGVRVWPMIDFEADDALATAARRWADDPKLSEVLICSPDKDLYQVLDHPRIRSWDRIRNNYFNEAAVIQKLGIPPGSVADYLALVGDSADGIPGIPRWGAKSTSAVLEQFKHIESIPSDINLWPKIRGAKTLSENLENMRDAAILFKRLATLRTDVPLEEELEDLRWAGIQVSKLKNVCETLGDQAYFSVVLSELKS